MAQAAATYLGEERRRSMRLDQTSPVIIRGVDLLGQPFEERTATQNLGFQGCRYASKHHLPKNTWITLEVPSGDSRKEAVCIRARVAWIQRPRTLRELFQVGVELEKGKNIWNLSFPPGDWISDRPAELSVVVANVPSGPANTEGESLEDYLRMAWVNRESASGDEQLEMNDDGNAAMAQLRQEFLGQPEEIVAEARATAEELMRKRTSEFENNLQSSQQASAKAFYEQWLKEFERERTNTKREIASAVSEDVAAQLASFQAQARDTLSAEWAEKLGRAQIEFSKWESDAQALRDEVRANAEAALNRSDELLNEKLRQIRRELELSLKASTVEAAQTSGSASEAVRGDLSKEIETARGHWSELLEASLDGAARRLAERMARGSQELLRKAEQDLAGRVAELQKESGIAAEMSRAALDELKIALARELSQAKDSLKQIEQSAANYSEYSRQLEAASQDSLNELRDRLGSAVTEQCADMGKRVAELERKLTERTSLLLEQQSRETVERSSEEIESRAAAAVESAAKAAEELAAREEQAENILQIHRERLRQVSEQIEREGAAHFASSLANLQDDFGRAREEALKTWREELATKIVQAKQEASAALDNESAKKLHEAAAQLEMRAQHTIQSAQEGMSEALEATCGKFRVRFDETEARELERAREMLGRAVSEQLEMANSEFTKAAEAAASELGERIAESRATTLADFSAASGAQAEQTRERLATAGESVLQRVQNGAQTSFAHFQEQLAIKTEQAIRQAGETLAHQFDEKIEKMRAEGEALMKQWSARQEALGEQALEKNQEKMRAAANSTIESALEQLDEQSEERMNRATEATERAVCQACADAFEAVAQKMKEQVETAAELRHPSAPGEMNPQHHASA